MNELCTHASYYACIVESARETLAVDPANTLHRQVTANISGGHYFWDDGANRVYESPVSLEEALLALELREVLLTAVQNQLSEVLQVANTRENPLDIFGLPMDFGLLFSTAIKLARRDPRSALTAKLAMAKIAQHFEARGLATFIGKHCFGFEDLDEGELICAQF